MKRAILTKGLIASGKSTWAKEFVKIYTDYNRLSRDDFRHMLDGYSFSDETEATVTRMMNACLEDLMDREKNIIIDEQHLNEKFLNARVAQLEGRGYEVTIKEFPVHLQVAIERDKKRIFSIGAGAIKNTWKRYELELKAMLEKAKPVYPDDDTLEAVVICDIDGTLSNSFNRKIFDFKACVNDRVIEPVEDLLDMYADCKVKIILFSGREDICRAETIQWLDTNKIAYDELYMRKEKDHRDDTVVKREMFDEYIRGKYNVKCVIDDRISVCQMWVDLGLFVFCVNQDPFAKNQF